MTHEPYTGPIEAGKVYENFLGMRRRVTRIVGFHGIERSEQVSFVRIAPDGKDASGNTVFTANFRRWIAREVQP
jgi:hypothetical protein